MGLPTEFQMPPSPRRSTWWGIRGSRLAAHILVALGSSLTAGAATAAGVGAMAGAGAPAHAEFNDTFLAGENGKIDISRFERGNPMQAGTHRVDVYVNEYLVTREDVVFRDGGDDIGATPCFDRTQLGLMGVDTGKLEAQGVDLDSDCVDLARTIPDATVATDAGELRLDISIPQVALLRNPRGYVDPKLWKQGMNAFMLQYNFNGSQFERSDYSSRSGYLGLEAGLNLGGWRIRNQSSFNWLEHGGSDFQNIRTYAQRDIDRLQSQLTIGDTFTTGQLFDSTGVRGISLATDTRMRPDSTNGYAPVVRGVAETNARVLVQQSGYVVYETTVAPGNFEITDIAPTGFGGDLTVTVVEADGRAKTFSVPFAAVPNLLRPGTSNYSATVGQVRDQYLQNDAPNFFEGTYQRGINNWMTGYAGAQLTDGGLYGNLLVGAAFNTPVGAVSLDVSNSRTRFSNNAGDQSGYSARVTYNKSFPETATTFALAAYRYSSKGYLGLSDAVRMDDAVLGGRLTRVVEGDGATRNRFQLTLNQHLGDRAGDLYISGSRDDYWFGRPVSLSYSAGYSNRYRDVSYGVTATRTRLFDGQYDDSVFLNVTVPLGRSTPRYSAPVLGVQAAHSSQGNGVTASVNGNFGERNRFSYGATSSLDNNGEASIGVNAGWRAAYATLGANYTQNSGATGNSRQTGISATGGLVIHRGGITLAPSLGETIGVVEAPGAYKARLTSSSTTRVDRRGYAVVTSLTPYRMNDVMLDPQGTSNDVELKNARLQVAPRAGAVVPLKFETDVGVSHLLKILRTDGQSVPFGAEVVDEHDRVVGYIGQGGQAMVRLEAGSTASLSVRWGNGERCSVDWKEAADAGAAAPTNAQCSQ